jgi:signal peptidase I
MNGRRRPLLARLGLVLLNIPAPGLGLLRTTEPRLALTFLLMTPTAFLLLIAFYAAAPTLDFTAYLVSAGLLLLAGLSAVLGSMLLTWRPSAFRADGSLRWWSRWYSLAAAGVLEVLLTAWLAGSAHGFYKPFYIPSEGMMPTLLKDDRLIASMRGPAELRRGDIILFRVGEWTYIKRLAALPGDRIAFEGGAVILNGARVDQQPVGMERVEGPFGPTDARRLRERFPGEAGEHQIYDLGPSEVDDRAEAVVRPGHVFVLGDNRDRSADSRVPRDQMGVDQLPVGDILGKALFHTWGRSEKMGEPLTR